MEPDNDFIYLYIRTPYVGEMSRELHRLSAPTVLAWFQKAWDADFKPDPQTPPSLVGFTGLVRLSPPRNSMILKKGHPLPLISIQMHIELDFTE